MAGVYWPICSCVGKRVQCNLISASWHLLINAIRAGQRMSFRIHIQGAHKLADVRVAQTVGLRGSYRALQWVLSCPVLLLDPILPALVSQKDCSKQGSWEAYGTHKGCSDCYSTASSGVAHWLCSAWGFPRLENGPHATSLHPANMPAYSPRFSSLASLRDVFRSRYRCPKYQLKNNI